MAEIIKVALAIIASLGSSAAIIMGVSSYLGKIWADRFLQKKSQEFEKDIEHYKNQLSMEVEKYRIKAEQLTYISKIQFETEYQIYRKIFESLFDFTAASSNLFPYRINHIPLDVQERKEEYIKRYQFYMESFNSYSLAVETNAPFIPKEIYDKFIKIRNSAHEIACMFPEIRIQADERFAEDYAKIAAENFKKTKEFNESVLSLNNDVREYLSNLKVLEVE